jgi:hypothetical protein
MTGVTAEIARKRDGGEWDAPTTEALDVAQFGRVLHERPRKGDWMQTFTGRQFWPLDPRVDEIDIRDIAHSLSQQCRYAGHCDRFYSVAEHSVLMSRYATPVNRLAVLLHDAAEAYLVDVPRPVKKELVGYADIEHLLDLRIAQTFGFNYPWPEEVKALDDAILHDEKAQLMRPAPVDWCLRGKPLGVDIECWGPFEAEVNFLKVFDRCCGS